MLPSTMTARRTPNPTITKDTNGPGHWRLDSNGAIVDSGDWELADDLSKLQIGGDGAEAQRLRFRLWGYFPPGLGPASPSSSHRAHTSAQNSIGLVSHSRESSADTTGSQGSAMSSGSQNLRAPPVTPLKVGAVGESRNRPHSYSGGLSSTDLVRLQQAGGSPGNTDAWSSPHGTPERQAQQEQPTYPSLLASHNGSVPRLPEANSLTRSQEDLSGDAQGQQRLFNGPHGAPMPPNGAPPAFVHGRPPNVATNVPYRQPPPRAGFNPAIAPVVPSPTNFGGYPAPVHPGGMPLANPQQDLYSMMLPTPPLDNPTMARLQQQSGVFQRTHQHSASDPASLRDPATIALLNNVFAAGQMYPPTMAPPALNMFQNQFYGGPGAEPYPSPEMAAQMMAQLQAQYTGPYGVPMGPQGIAIHHTGGSHSGTATGNGPSANNRKLGLYKTELCRSWEEKGSCRYGQKCQFAHGEDELRKVQRHPKYKTEICRTFWVSGSCPYGKRCCFIHTELPANGGPPGADGAIPPGNLSGRERSSSTNSDPNEVSTSLLARITAKRSQETTMHSNSGSTSTTPPSAGFQGMPVNSGGGGGRPEALRVNTNVSDVPLAKQNKSAYPTFANVHNGILMSANDEPIARSPGPVTAGPDFGRHASSRLDIVGSQRGGPKTAVNPNVRHSFNGSEMGLDLSSLANTPTTANSATPVQSQPPTHSQNASPEPQRVSRINGHSFDRVPVVVHSRRGAEDNSPWADYNVNQARLAEKNWA
ncbi:uncharacterized protein BXZ73DRAFT_91698 [Epithele typhae]|uniref:uncharacterized protein n=1 Tax=Epithele typhae TaxID=378194 RepID=UPI002007E5E0|nr:uncharacterized protein BXZ73DRAFT_91698 [Epithele typhae]KAH9922008.1 hypothetical protein BXZ73DRAFT_91698 [Epithele typhae]